VHWINCQTFDRCVNGVNVTTDVTTDMTPITKYTLFVDSYETRIALYESIHNLSQVLEWTQTHDNICLISAQTIFDTNQILCAINKSIDNKNNNKLITKRLNKEILFSLSLSKNITESLKTFGVTPTDDSLPVIVLSVDQMNDTLNTEVFDKIDGKLLAIDSLKSLRNDSLIDKIYNLKNCTNESQKWDLIVTRIATKDIVWFHFIDN